MAKRNYSIEELRDMGFMFDLNGNLVSAQELEKMHKRGLEWYKTQWLSKAEEWIDSTFFEYEREAPFCSALQTEVCTHLPSKYALIQNFRKFIESE